MRKPAAWNRRVQRSAEPLTASRPGEGSAACSAVSALLSSRRVPGVRALSAVFALAFALALALACFLVTPSSAHAADYSMPQVDIAATVGADGSLHVVEERTFSYSGGASEAVFALDMPYGGKLTVNGVWVGDPDDIDQNGNVISTPLQRTSFDLAWRDDKSTGPAVSSYAVDGPRNTVYVFFNAAEETCVVTLDYTVEDALGVYRDAGELYWSYVNSNWEVDSQNVTLTVRLPVPAGTEIVPNETVYAWGHGPEDGAVAINADGSVTYTCPTVRAGQYAAARVLFPTEWLSAVPQKVRLEHQTTDILESVVKEEATWSDTASAHRESSLTFHVVVVAASALLLLAAGIAWACFGKERRPRWQGESWQEAPEPGMHPAVAGRLWRFDHASSKDLVASVMRVVDAGLVGLTREEAVNGVNDVQTRWFLTRKASKRDAAEAALGGESGRTAAGRLDEATVSLLFDDIAEGVNTLSFDGIVRGAEAIPRQYVDAVRAWQDVVSAEVRERGLFDERGWKLQMPVVVIGVAWALVGAAAWFLQNDTTTAWAMIPAGALVALFGANLPRRSQEGADLNAKCEAFRAWLVDRPVDEAGEADAGDAGSAGEASDAAAAGEVRNAGSAGEASDATKAAEVGNASDAADASNAAESADSEALEPYAYVLGVRSSEAADALERAFDEAWKTAREGVRVRRS